MLKFQISILFFLLSPCLFAVNGKDANNSLEKKILRKIKEMAQGQNQTDKEIEALVKKYKEIHAYNKQLLSNQKCARKRQKDALSKQIIKLDEQLERAKQHLKAEKDPLKAESIMIGIARLTERKQTIETQLAKLSKRKKREDIPFLYRLDDPEEVILKAQAASSPVQTLNNVTDEPLKNWDQRDPKYSKFLHRVSSKKYYVQKLAKSLRKVADPNRKQTIEKSIKELSANILEEDVQLKEMKANRAPYPPVSQTTGFPEQPRKKYIIGVDKLPVSLNSQAPALETTSDLRTPIFLLASSELALHSLQNPNLCLGDIRSNAALDSELDPFFANMHTYPQLFDTELFLNPESQSPVVPLDDLEIPSLKKPD